MQQELYKQNKQTISCYETIKDLKNLSKEKEFLKEIDSMVLRTTSKTIKKVINTR